MAGTGGATSWRAALTALLLACAAPAPAADAFLVGLDDVPLMPRLTELADVRLRFDSAAGRVVEATAVGPVAPADVLAFYARALPALGWRAETETAWSREGERLRIEFPRARTSGEISVRFFLAPN